jgi:hypothetical protein
VIVIGDALIDGPDATSGKNDDHFEELHTRRITMQQGPRNGQWLYPGCALL